MQYLIRLMVVLLVISALQYTACSPSKSETAAKVEPAHVEHIDGSELSRVTFTAAAMQRIGVELGQVEETLATRSGANQKTVPYSTLIYDANGDTWIYVSPEERTFIRHHITVDYIEGDKVVLIDGPPTATKVVTVGAAEVYGTEYGVGH